MLRDGGRAWSSGTFIPSNSGTRDVGDVLIPITRVFDSTKEHTKATHGILSTPVTFEHTAQVEGTPALRLTITVRFERPYIALQIASSPSMCQWREF